jgi:hypothetical protein
LSFAIEGNQLIPNELVDRVDFMARFQKTFFPFPFDFLLIGFKLGDDLLEVAHLLPCDHMVKILW